MMRETAVCCWPWILWDTALRSSNSVWSLSSPWFQHNLNVPRSELFPIKCNQNHEFTFRKGTSITRLVIRSPLYNLVPFLPRLFKLLSSAPHLQTLQIFTDVVGKGDLWDLAKVQGLDECIKSHPSLQQVVFAPTRNNGGNFWDEFKKYMPYCIETGMIEFRKCFFLEEW